MHTITCLYCGDTIPEIKIEPRRIMVPTKFHELTNGGCRQKTVMTKQLFHNTDFCVLSKSTLFSESSKEKENCYRRHQDFLTRLEKALDSDNPKMVRFARKCLWQMLSRKPTKYMNKQITSMKNPPKDIDVQKKFRSFWKQPIVVKVK